MDNRTVKQGDKVDLKITAESIDGEVVPLSSVQIDFLLFEKCTPDTAIMTKSTANSPGEITINDPDTGVFTVHIGTGETDDLEGTYYFEIQLTDINGDKITLTNNDIVTYPCIEIVKDVIS